MFGFTGKDKKKYIGNTKIAFEPNLINEFEEEHKNLLVRFFAMEKAIKGGRAKKISESVIAFSKMLRAHLLKENIKFYVYLSHAVKKNPANSEIVMEYKREMLGIGKVVTDFVARYSSSSLTSNQILEMASEIEEIKNVLLERIESEESILYPLYLSPESYE